MASSVKTKVELMFGGRCGRAPQGVQFAPGRVVLLGEHLDHQGGRVLAAPVREGIACAWGVRPDTRVVIWGMNARQKDSFHQGQFVKSGRSWADLARGACAHVSEGGRRLPGIDLMVLGDLPMGEGLASSAAYLVVVLRSLYEAIGEYRSKWELAEDVPAIEREWRGVHCGPMDPYVVAAARSDRVLELDCNELNHELLDVPAGYEIATVDTGVRRELASTPYTLRVQELAAALAEVQALGLPVERLVDLDPEALQRIADRLTPPGAARARHVVTESRRVAEAAAALRAGDAPTVGRLMVEGHRSLARDFESSLPAIDEQVDALLERQGVLGARLQGAGWGGRIAVLQARAQA